MNENLFIVTKNILEIMEHKKRLVLAIDGLSRSGKTTFVDKLFFY